jgi:hypothetical protein
VQRIADPLVLYREPGGVFSRQHQYATSHRGFVFYARAKDPLFLPHGMAVVRVKKMWMPE